MTTDGVSDDQDEANEDGQPADVVDLSARNKRRSRLSRGRTVKTSLPADDAIPTGVDEEGDPSYAETGLDKRYDALLQQYDNSPPHPEFIVVSDAFFAIIAPENLAHANEAVGVLKLLIERSKRRTYYLLSKQLEALEASGAPHPTDDGPGWRA